MEYNDKNICEALKSRILILDGAMGTMIQSKGLTESDFAAGPFAGWPVALKGNNDVLNITRPDVIGAIHRSYIEAGSDVITTNTFNCTRISQQEYGCQEQVGAMALAGARIAREAADGAGHHRVEPHGGEHAGYRHRGAHGLCHIAAVHVDFLKLDHVGSHGAVGYGHGIEVDRVVEAHGHVGEQVGQVLPLDQGLLRESALAQL